MNKPQFYLVWKENNNGRSPTYKHDSYEAACDEAKRLARVHGGKFHVMAHVATATMVEVTFEEVDPIPF